MRDDLLRTFFSVLTGMTTKPVLIFAIVFLLAACQAELVKTRNEIGELRTDVKALKERLQDVQNVRKRLETLETNVKGTVDLQKNLADYGARFDQFATDLQLLQGKVEENNFRLSELAQKLDDKSYKIAELSARLDELEAKLKSSPTGTSPAAGAPSQAKTPEPSEAYRQAMNDYNKGNFSLALAGFQNYLKQFPDASQADKAQYWIGECYYSTKDYAKAVEAFSKVLKTYPKSDKAPGALLKIGYSYLNENNTAKAREYLHRVVKQHPHSKEAELARDKLSKIGKQ